MGRLPLVPGRLAHNSAFWRRLAYLGARHGPRFWLRWSPPAFALLFALALPRARRAVRANLRWVRGPRGFWQEQRELFATFSSYACCLAEGLAGKRAEAEAARVTVVGGDDLKRLLGAGQGVVIVTAHLGPWDAASRLLRREVGADVLIAMQAETDAGARVLHDELRAVAGVRVVHVGTHPLDALPLVHHLRRSGVVAIQLDRGSPSARLLAVRLFERSFAFPEGPFRLAALTGAPIVPVFACRRGLFDYTLRVGPTLRVGNGIGECKPLEAAEVVAKELEAAIAAAPTQWFHFDGRGAHEA